MVFGYQKARIDRKGVKNVTENISPVYKVEVILHVNIIDKPYPLKNLEADGEMAVIPMYLECIDKISSIRLHLCSDAKSKEGLRQTYCLLKEVFKKLNGVIPLLDPIKDIGITNPEFLSAQKHFTELEEKEAYRLLLSC